MKDKWVKRIITLLVVVMVAMLLATSCAKPTPPPTGPTPPTPPPEKGPIKLGCTFPITGAGATKGVPGIAGYLDAIKYVNEELGGIDGHLIDCLWLDNAYEASKMMDTYKLIRETKCLLGSNYSSAMAVTIREATDRDKLPWISSYSVPQMLHPPGHMYCTAPDHIDEIEAFVGWFKKNVWKEARPPKVVFHLLDNPMGWSARDVFKEPSVVKETGIEVLSMEFHKAVTASELESLTRVKAMNPDLIVYVTTPPPMNTCALDGYRLGIPQSGIIQFTTKSGLTEETVELAGAEACEGIYLTLITAYHGEDVPGMAKMLEYGKKYNPEEYYKEDYRLCWAQALAICEALKMAVKNVGYENLTTETVEMQGIRKVKFDVGGLQGPIDWTDDYDRRGAKSLRIAQCKGGKIMPISGWTECPVVHYEEFEWFGK